MSLAFTRIDVGDPERARLLARLLAALRPPAGEDWLGRISARPSGSWELLLSGPCRHFVADWQTSIVAADRELYRRALPADAQGAENVRRIVRALLWDRLTVIVDDDSPLGRQLEEAAWDVLTRSGLVAAEVRLARWPSSWGECRFIGTVEVEEHGGLRIAWCGVVRTPAELGRALLAAMPAAAPVLPPAAVGEAGLRNGSTAAIAVDVLSELQIGAGGVA